MCAYEKTEFSLWPPKTDGDFLVKMRFASFSVVSSSNKLGTRIFLLHIVKTCSCHAKQCLLTKFSFSAMKNFEVILSDVKGSVDVRCFAPGQWLILSAYQAHNTCKNHKLLGL